MPENFAFSTGAVRVGAPGATLTDSDAITAIQNFQLNVSYEEAFVRGATFDNQYPLADAQYDNSLSATFETQSLPELLIPYILGVNAVSGGGKRTYTGTLTGKPEYCQIQFLGQMADGRDIVITFPRAKLRTFSPSFTRDGFQSLQQEAMSLPNSSYAAIVIEIDE